MPEIEDRLRVGLNALADEVTPSEDARAELTRRVAARRRLLRRAPVLTAAAAAVIVAAVFVPIATNRDAPTAVRSPAATAPSGRELPVLGSIVRDGARLRAVGQLDGANYCTAVESSDRSVRMTCEPVPTGEGPDNWFVQSRELLNGDPADDTGELANRLVFLTDPRVATLEVLRGDGTAVSVVEIDRNEHAAAFLADFAGPPGAFEYTARSANGEIVAGAIN
jgi:hypothetical protein